MLILFQFTGTSGATGWKQSDWFEVWRHIADIGAPIPATGVAPAPFTDIGADGTAVRIGNTGASSRLLINSETRQQWY